jgi:hypothetical protein
MATAVQEQPQPKQEQKKPAADDMGAALVAARFTADAGWRNANVCGHSWRCNRWVIQGYSGSIVESHYVTATPDGLVVQ